MSIFNKAGRWFDKQVLQNKWTNAVFPASLITMPYQFATKTGLFAKPKMPGIPAMTGTAPPDLTDQAIRDVEERQRRSAMMGSRKSSFLTGPLADRSQISDYTKSILGS